MRYDAEPLWADHGLGDVRPRELHWARVQRVRAVRVLERVHAGWVRSDGVQLGEPAFDVVQRDVRDTAGGLCSRPSDVPVWFVGWNVQRMRAVRVHGAVHAGELRCERMLRASGIVNDVHRDVCFSVVLRYCGRECDVYELHVQWRIHRVL